jgi:hypothetical protein
MQTTVLHNFGLSPFPNPFIKAVASPGKYSNNKRLYLV